MNTGQAQTAAAPAIAVVDDDPSFLRSLGRLLRIHGYAVSLYASGVDFLAALAPPLPICVLMDVHMPALSGPEVQEVLAAQGIHLPIIFVTAQDTPCAQALTKRATTVALLIKPFDQQLLFQAIRSVGHLAK